MTLPPDGRPFSTLGALPFLWLDAEGESRLHQRYRDLSRQHHPDRVDPANREALERAESSSARLNQDYRKLRELWLRLETVAAINAPVADKTKPVPELALEWFELQELGSESGTGSDEYRRARETFERTVRERLQNAEARLIAIARRHPFVGFRPDAIGESPPAYQTELGAIRAGLDERRYLLRLLDDLDRPAS